MQVEHSSLLGEPFKLEKVGSPVMGVKVPESPLPATGAWKGPLQP